MTDQEKKDRYRSILHEHYNNAYRIALLFSYRPTQDLIKRILRQDIPEQTEIYDLKPKDLGEFINENSIDLLITNSLGLHESKATENRWYKKEGDYRLSIGGKEVKTLILNNLNYDSLLDKVSGMICNSRRYNPTSTQ